METNRRLALLIDGDNITQVSLMPQILDAAKQNGAIKLMRVYGDLTKPHMANWIKIHRKHELELRHQESYTKSKNATDMALVIDAMDLLHTDKEINGFCIASDDGDFIPLAEHLQNRDLFVLGIGTKKASLAFVNACKGKFAFVGKPQNGTQAKVLKPAVTRQAVAKTITMSKALKKLFRAAFEAVGKGDSWVNLGELGKSLHEIDPEFEPRTHGHKQLSQLVEAYPDFIKVRKSQSTSGSAKVEVRLKENNKAAK